VSVDTTPAFFYQKREGGKYEYQPGRGLSMTPEERKQDWTRFFKNMNLDSLITALRFVRKFGTDEEIAKAFANLHWGFLNISVPRGTRLDTTLAEDLKIDFEKNKVRHKKYGWYDSGFCTEEEDQGKLEEITEIADLENNSSPLPPPSSYPSPFTDFTKAHARKIGKVKTVNDLLSMIDNPPKKRGRSKRKQARKGGAK